MLLAQVKTQGLLTRRPAGYIASIAAHIAMLCLGWVGLAYTQNSWLIALIAIGMGGVSTRLGLLAHDAGHSQISTSRKLNYTLGIFSGNLAIGIGIGWWIPKHQQHHVHPNREGKDPDLVNKFVALTPFHPVNRRPVFAIIRKHQAKLYFLLISSLAILWHIYSIRALLHRQGRHLAIESITLVGHFVAYCSAAVLIMSPLHALLFVALNQAAFGSYMGSIFAPNHKGMTTWRRDQDVDFLTRQVLSSRNVRGSFLTDFIYGGLNYQIEHHLFPSMPRRNLRHAVPIVRAFCQDRNIAYSESNIWGSYRAIVVHLSQLSKPPPGQAA